MKKRSKGFDIDRIICLELEKDPKSFDLLDEEAKKYYSDLMKDFNKLERSEFSVQEISEKEATHLVEQDEFTMHNYDENGDFFSITVKGSKTKGDFWQNELKIKAAMALIETTNFESYFEEEEKLAQITELIQAMTAWE